MNRNVKRPADRIVMTVIICAIACILPSGGLPAQTVRDTVFTQSGETSELRAGLDAWKARLGRIPDAHLPRFDDRDWQIVRTPHRWEGEGTDCWFRRMFVVPGGMNGKAMALELAMDGWGELFVNGQSREKFRNRCVHEITAFARAGEVFHLAVHGKSETVFGMLMDATLTAEDAVDADLAKRASRIDALRASMVAGVCDGWLYHEGDGVPQASVPGEGRGWRGASLPHLWQRDNVAVWYRKTLTVPDRIGGYSAEGEAVAMEFDIDDDCELFVDGARIRAFRDLGSVVLSERARPGETHEVAFRVFNRAGWGGLSSVRLRLANLDAEAKALHARIACFLRARAAGMGFLLPQPHVAQAHIERVIGALSASSALDARANLAKEGVEMGGLDGAFARYPLITAGPYLQNLSRDGVTVMWETNTPSTTVLEWGAERGATRIVSNNKMTRMHRVRISSLSPDRNYRYRVRSGNTRTPFYPFRSAPGHRSPFTFAVAADTHASFCSLQERIIEEMVRRRPRFAVFAGDVTNTGSVEEWRMFHLHAARKLMRSTPTYIAPGNHDHYLSRPDGKVEAIGRFTEHPGNGYYYAFTQGNSRFIVLDTSIENEPGVSPGGEQYRWLASELEGAASRRATWRFVFLHHPVYSEGWADRYYDGEAALQRHLVPLFERYGVTVAFSGHTHDFEFGRWPERTGVCYVITGGGGGLLDDTRYRDWPQIQKVAFEYHFCTVSVDERRAALHAIDARGRTIHRFEVQRKSSGK